MDAITQEIVNEIQQMTKSQKKDVLAVVMFYHWQRHGGRKTAKICRGEKLYNQFQRAQLAEKTV